MGTWDLETGFKSEPEYENVSVKRFFRVREGVYAYYAVRMIDPVIRHFHDHD